MRSKSVLCWLGIGLVVLLMSGSPSSRSAAQDKPKAEAKIADLEKRLEQIENNLKEVTRILKQPGPRYQMLSAGDRVVILDTETGKVEKIEPATKTVGRYQTFAVGRSVIVVDTTIGTIKAKDEGAK